MNCGLGEDMKVDGNSIEVKPSSGVDSVAIDSGDTSKDRWTFSSSDSGGEALLHIKDEDTGKTVVTLNGDDGSVTINGDATITGELNVTGKIITNNEVRGGILRATDDGGYIRLTSPNGSETRILSCDNNGDMVWGTL